MAKYRHKQPQLPATFQHGFLERMDGRERLVRDLKMSYEELTSDLGGADSLSHVRRVLAERFVWLTAILRGLEAKIPSATDQEASDLLGKWVQGLNSLTGLARTLGLERRAKSVPSLQSYVQSKERKK